MINKTEWIENFHQIKEDEDIFINEYFSFYWNNENANIEIYDFLDFESFYNSLNLKDLNRNQITILALHDIMSYTYTDNITKIIQNDENIKNNIMKFAKLVNLWV